MCRYVWFRCSILYTPRRIYYWTFTKCWIDWQRQLMAFPKDLSIFAFSRWFYYCCCCCCCYTMAASIKMMRLFLLFASFSEPIAKFQFSFIEQIFFVRSSRFCYQTCSATINTLPLCKCVDFGLELANFRCLWIMIRYYLLVVFIFIKCIPICVQYFGSFARCCLEILLLFYMSSFYFIFVSFR